MVVRTSAFELFSTNRSRAPVVAPGPGNGSSRHDRLSPNSNIFNCPRGHKKGPTSVEPHTATESRHVRLCGCQLHVRDDPVSPRLLRRAPDNIQSRAPRIFTISRLHSAAQVLFSLRGGAEGIRTPDLRRAKAALSQLSYGPGRRRVGQPGIEPGTSVLSGLRSSRLSYWPHWADRPSVAHARGEHTPAASVGRAGSSACLSIGGTGKASLSRRRVEQSNVCGFRCARGRGWRKHGRGIKTT